MRLESLFRCIVLIVAVGVLAGVRGHIARVDVVHARFHGNLPALLQRGDRRSRQIRNPICRMEARKVHGNIGAEVLYDPLTHLFDLVWRVV